MEGSRVNFRLPLLTTLIALLVAHSAAAWQVQSGPRPDPYAQPPLPNGNTAFRFGQEQNQPMPQPQFAPPFPQQPAPQQPFQPQPQINPQQFQQPPQQFAPPQQQPFAPPPLPAVNQPPMQGAANAGPPRAPFIPGFDPNEAPVNVNPNFDRTLFQPSQIVATVGNLYILYGDVEPAVNQMLLPALAKASPAERAQIEQMRPRLIQQVTRQQVESKLMYLEFEREIEQKAGRDKMNEVRAEMTKRLRDNFEKQLAATREKVQNATPAELQELSKRDPIVARLAILMKENEIETLGDLDKILRKNGSTLEKQQRSYLEMALGRSTISEKIKVKQEVSHLEMLNYYRDHADDFAVKARARFEIISVKFANFPNRDAAWQAMAQMGNEVFFGTPFAAVAKRGSQDINAAKGGIYDWTNEKSLASDAVDRTVFSLEPGRLSTIVEDEKGLHIIRVIERQPAGFIPFTDAQVKIKELITQQRRDVVVKQLLEDMRSKTVVWTVYDAEAAANVAGQPGANPQR